MSRFSQLTPKQLAVLRLKCERDFLTFCRVFFEVHEGSRLIVGAHHKVLCDLMQHGVAYGSVSRLIVNIPPGYTKTLIISILFPAWSFAVFGACRFINSSFSDDRALENSLVVRDIIQSDLYQLFWPTGAMRKDSTAKKLWRLENGGSFYAVPTGGSVTSFRGGFMREGFSGAILIDDPIKPDDATSEVKRVRINTRFNNTFRSRLAVESVPIVIIMQRLHEDDYTGFLLRGGSGDKWHWLSIPVVHPDRPMDVPKDYTHALPVKYDLPAGPLWPYKHTLEQIDVLKRDEYTYSSQYLQRPAPVGGGIFKAGYWQYYNEYNFADNVLHIDRQTTTTIDYKMIFADTACKTGQHNDFSVAQCWGYSSDTETIYLLDQIRGKWEAPDLREQIIAFFDRHDFKQGVNQVGVRSRFVEDKVSGTGLIQDINRMRGQGAVEGIQRDRDKVSRAHSVVSKIRDGKVSLPRYVPWIDDFILECSLFTPLMTHKHDDQIDPMMDAISKMLIFEPTTCYTKWV